MKKLSTLLAMVMIAASTAVVAADSADLMKACAAEKDDAARLACYDRAAGAAADSAAMADEAARAAEAAAASKAAEAEAASMAAEKEAAARAAEAEAAAMAVEKEAVAKAEAAERAAAEAEFGMNRDLENKDPARKAEKEKELRELVAEVVEVRNRPSGEHIVTLENGQVWVEKSAVYGFRVRVGDTVTLKKGVFGGYKLVTSSRRSSQVRRVE